MIGIMINNDTVDIFTIPFALQQDVLGSWLTIKDVAKLDRAICSKEVRPIYLELLSNKDLILITSITIEEYNVSWIVWMSSRKVSVTNCNLCKAVGDSAQYLPFFTHTGKRLEALIISRLWKDEPSFIQMLSCAAAYCTNIKTISLQGCFTMHGLENILQASQNTLCKVNFSSCDLGDFQLEDLELTSLQFLSMRHCKNFINKTVKQILRPAYIVEIRSCYCSYYWHADMIFAQHLRVLTIDTSDIKDNWFCSVVHNCPLLEVVELSNCNLLTDISVIELVQHAEHLSALYLSTNTKFSDRALEAIAEHCGERLRHLCLYGCEQLTDDGLQHMNKCCHHLEGLGIGFIFNEHFTIPSVPALLQNNPLLQEVSISWEEDADGLMATIARSCPQLRYLDIRGLHGYTEAGIIMAIRSSSTTLRTVAVRHQCTIFRQLIHSSWNKQYRPDVEFLYPSDGLLPFWKQYRS